MLNFLKVRTSKTDAENYQADKCKKNQISNELLFLNSRQRSLFVIVKN